MAYFVHLMDSVANKDFVLVYFHTESIVQEQLSTDFFKQLYLMLDERWVYFVVVVTEKQWLS